MSKTEAVVTFAIGLALVYFAYTQLTSGKPKSMMVGLIAGVIGLYVTADSIGPALEALALPIIAVVVIFIAWSFHQKGRERERH